MRLVYAVAAHLHMTAGAVMNQMGAHELLTWGFIFNEQAEHARLVQERQGAPLVLSVEDEIALWG
jgi:hypothetical protein